MNKSVLQNTLKAEAIKTIQKLNALFPDKQIDPRTITFKFNLRGTCAGKSCHQTKTLYFHLLLADQNFHDYVSQTIPHEVCHLYQYKFNSYAKPHGYEWQRLMLRLGLDPKRCHSYDTAIIQQSKKTPKVRHVYLCNCEEEKQLHLLTSYKHNQILNGAKYICKRCKSTLRTTGLLKKM